MTMMPSLRNGLEHGFGLGAAVHGGLVDIHLGVTWETPETHPKTPVSKARQLTHLKR